MSVYDSRSKSHVIRKIRVRERTEASLRAVLITAGEQALVNLRIFEAPHSYPLTKHLSAVPSLAMPSNSLPRLVFRQSRWMFQRRAQSSTTEAAAQKANQAKESVSQATSKAQESVSQATSKASQGVSRVQSSAGNVLRRASNATANAVSGVSGRTGRLINVVQGQYTTTRQP